MFKHIRFLGAAGIGMSALIRILEGQRVAGVVDSSLKISCSDLSYEQNDPLDQDIDLVVRSTAIAESDPDLVELKSRGVEIWHRSDMLNFLSSKFKQLVISGTHGKTTCSAMLTYLLARAGLDPSFAVGGILTNYKSNGSAGSGEYFVLEGDESDQSFTKTSPYLALVTCVESDHLENYPGGFAEIKQCFTGFLDAADKVVINIDDEVLYEYWKNNQAVKNITTYSSNNKEADFVLDRIYESGASFEHKGSSYEFKLEMQGEHNFLNALGCVAAATALGLEVFNAAKAMQGFRGIKRRFELINPNYQGVKVYDDYAHHPTEIKALLESILKLKPRKLVFVYQPHHPERTQQFWSDFVEFFQNFPAEHLALVADIYVARSKHIAGVDSKTMVEQINRNNVKYLAPTIQELTSQGNFTDMVAALKPGIEAQLDSDCDYLFLVGAGNIAKVAEAFVPVSIS